MSGFDVVFLLFFFSFLLLMPKIVLLFAQPPPLFSSVPASIYHSFGAICSFSPCSFPPKALFSHHVEKIGTNVDKLDTTRACIHPHGHVSLLQPCMTFGSMFTLLNTGQNTGVSRARVPWSSETRPRDTAVSFLGLQSRGEHGRIHGRVFGRVFAHGRVDAYTGVYCFGLPNSL